MCRILRWTGYASTLIGAVFIVMAIVGVFRYHHHNVQAHAQVCCDMQKTGGMTTIKIDSSGSKQLSVSACKGMGMKDSSKCIRKEIICTSSSPMGCNGCQMYSHRIGFHMGLAICFLLLAIALMMICNACRCCECKDGKCECKEEKKE